MQFEERFANALGALKVDSQDRSAMNELCSPYWTWLAESLGKIICDNGDTKPFIDENVDLIDYGITSLVDVSTVKPAISDCDISDCRIQVKTISQWLVDLLLKVRQGDKLDKLDREHKVQSLQHKKLQTEIKDLQAERRLKIENMYFRPTDPAKSLTELENTEKMQLDDIRKKKEISKGAFLTAEQKREHVRQQVELQKRLQFATTFVATLPSKEGSTEVKNMGKTLEQLFIKLVEIESSMKKLADELEGLQKKTSEMHPSEIENRLTEEIEYVRDLVKLSAKRMGLEPFPLIRPEDKLFSLSVLAKNLNQITEFDPRIFKNDRVPLFGRPYVLLVPGTGNAIFDWKNNCIIMPTISPGGNFMGSLATGIIEYRLDVDEDKVMLTSYNQLPDLKTIRSIIQIKARLVKEYIIWMTSEYNGYRILSKESKNWFEYEIGPSKNEMFTPLEYQGYTMTSMEFNKLFDDIMERIKKAEEAGADPDPEDLWGGSLLHYQMGKPEKALPLIEQYMKVRPDHLMGWYNLGHVAMKQMNRTLAREAFNTFCKMDTQSWWSKVVRNHLRALGT
jgi:tetratricopeptide (TPR) repeat protein